MYDDSNDAHLKPTTIPMYPRCPDMSDPRWRDVAVRSRSQNHTEIQRFPTEARGMEIATVYSGDTISIMPEVKYQYYVAARVGYHVGWVNFQHVKLVSLQSRNRGYLEETKPNIPHDQDQRIAQRQAEMQQRALEADQMHARIAEEETQPASPRMERKPAPIARKDVNRIINKLKSLGGIFSRR